MKKVIRIAVLLALASSLGIAYAGPRENADVMKRAMTTSGGSWLARFGHVALYDAKSKRTLEVGVEYPAIEQKPVSSMTGGPHYEGARYGIGSTRQHYRSIWYGKYQRNFYPHYTISPYYREGKWTYRWSWSWRHWRWTKKWYKQSAKFRCDSFVNYCYKKGTGRHLVKWLWTTTPSRVFNALPHRRQSGRSGRPILYPFLHPFLHPYM